MPETKAPSAGRKKAARPQSGANRDPLATYHGKRDFSVTPEPAGVAAPSAGAPSFVVQKHDARRLHFDFRLEWGGVLWSWAVPKGPSLDPKTRRLAMRTEDHPLDYADFEGVIPPDQYGAGAVIVWDRGTWQPDGDPDEAMREGHLVFTLEGERMKGRWHLVRTGGEGREAWLLFKGRDAVAKAGVDLAPAHDDSVVSGRTLAQVRDAPDRVWRRASFSGEDVPGAVQRPLPEPEAQLAKLVEAPPDGEGWLHELKYDGYRVLAVVEEGRARLVTRNGNDWTEKLAPIAGAVLDVAARSALLDGEIAVFDAKGRSDFGALQDALARGRLDDVRYVLFDALWVDGWDLRGVATWRRKEVLRALLPPAGRLRYSDHVEGNGPVFFAQACQMGLEGIVSKRKDATWRAGRSDAWRKVRCQLRQELVIGGYTTEKTALSALLVGWWDGDRLVYAGRVGTGFTDRARADLRRRLDPLRTADRPFSEAVGVKGARFVRPELVAEVAFSEWTKAGRTRHPVFVGLREDKDAREVTREAPSDGRERRGRGAGKVPPPTAAGRAAVGRIRVTSPERVLWPDAGVTKAELIAYWAAVGERALPELADRPLTLFRCPEGVGGACFYQRHETRGLGAHVKVVPHEGEQLIYVDTLEGLLELAQMSALEVHPWGARRDRPDRPDRLIFDLDPGEQSTWHTLADAALGLRELLAEVGLAAFARTTGGKGLHVVVPLVRRLGWDDLRAFARGVAAALVDASPTKLTLSHGLRGRKGRLYIDVLRNGPGATAVGSWSTRARPGAPVAVPVRWDEVPGLGGGDVFTIRDVGGRSEDAWPDFGARSAHVGRAARERFG